MDYNFLENYGIILVRKKGATGQTGALFFLPKIIILRL